MSNPPLTKILAITFMAHLDDPESFPPSQDPKMNHFFFFWPDKGTFTGSEYWDLISLGTIFYLPVLWGQGWGGENGF